MKCSYMLIKKGDNWIIRRSRYENLCIIDEYFKGYDFMGSVDWIDSTRFALEMEYAEADQIVKDLAAADAEEKTPKMLLTAVQINTLNKLAQENWDRAQGMLDGMNEILGTKYGWLAKRVVWFEDPDGNKYAACHDALAWAEE